MMNEIEQKFDEIINMINRVVCFTDSERDAKKRCLEMAKELKKNYKIDDKIERGKQ